MFSQGTCASIAVSGMLLQLIYCQGGWQGFCWQQSSKSTSGSMIVHSSMILMWNHLGRHGLEAMSNHDYTSLTRQWGHNKIKWWPTKTVVCHCWTAISAEKEEELSVAIAGRDLEKRLSHFRLEQHVKVNSRLQAMQPQIHAFLVQLTSRAYIQLTEVISPQRLSLWCSSVLSNSPKLCVRNDQSNQLRRITSRTSGH